MEKRSLQLRFWDDSYYCMHCSPNACGSIRVLSLETSYTIDLLNACLGRQSVFFLSACACSIAFQSLGLRIYQGLRDHIE